MLYNLYMLCNQCTPNQCSMLQINHHTPSNSVSILLYLAQKWRAEIHDERFVFLSDVFGDFHNGGGTDGEEEAGDVDEFGLFDECPTLVLVNVVEGEGIGSRQIGDEGAILARVGHDNGARA